MNERVSLSSIQYEAIVCCLVYESLYFKNWGIQFIP